MGERESLDAHLAGLAAASRVVCFAGLPGTGKSFLAHRLASAAHAAGRPVHLLQWDVVRPALETSEAGRRYPMQDGVTDPLIRAAAGLWAREAVARWHARHPSAADVLIAETPLVGHRFIELARRIEDAAEPLLASAACRFVVPVPSAEVRRALEAERMRRAARPRHDREREDAQPDVVRRMWDELVRAAGALGLSDDAAPRAGYDPALYARVYRRVLAHRRAQVLAVDALLPSAAASVYAFAFPTHDVVPAPAEAEAAIREAEARHPDAAALRYLAGRWYLV